MEIPTGLSRQDSIRQTALYSRLYCGNACSAGRLSRSDRSLFARNQRAPVRATRASTEHQTNCPKLVAMDSATGGRQAMSATKTDWIPLIEQASQGWLD